MNFSGLKELTIDGVGLVKLTINGVLAWKKGYKNWVPFSTEEDGVTIYNGGKGYKDGYRVRSGGAEGATSVGVCVGFIPAKAGDVVRVKEKNNRSIYKANASECAINYSDGSRTNIGQTAANGKYGIATSFPGFEFVSIGADNSWTFTVPNHADIRHIRISVHTNYQSNIGENLIITVNEEIE